MWATKEWSGLGASAMTTVGIFRLFPSLPGRFSTGKSFQVVFRALATVGWLTADFFRGEHGRISSGGSMTLSADGEGGFFAMIFFSAPTRVGRGTGFTSKCFSATSGNKPSWRSRFAFAKLASASPHPPSKIVELQQGLHHLLNALK